MSPILFALGGLIAVSAVGLLFVLAGLRFSSTSEEAQRLTQYVANPIQAQEARPDPLTFRRAELQGTFGQRLLLPWFRRLGGLLGFLTPARSLANLRRQLTIAGNPLGLGPREFYGLQLIFIVLGFWLAYNFLAPVLAPQRAASEQGSGLSTGQAALTPAGPQLVVYRFVGAILAVVIGSQLPKGWLRGRVRGRQQRIRRNLPDALDMLSVCAEAGLGFDQALQRVSERWATPLGKEFARVVEEMTMGLSRSEALRSLADRLDVGELSSFVAVMVQSDKMGVSITSTLRSQAEQMRVERRHRAQEEARKAPLKMLLPMIGLILPAMGAVVVGPVIPALMDVFSTVLHSAGR
jgi:tight adherence protein C